MKETIKVTCQKCKAKSNLTIGPNKNDKDTQNLEFENMQMHHAFGIVFSVECNKCGHKEGFSSFVERYKLLELIEKWGQR